MNWTTDRPTVPGWYWFGYMRDDGCWSKPICQRITDKTIRSEWYRPFDGAREIRWSGPIPEPEEGSDDGNQI